MKTTEQAQEEPTTVSEAPATINELNLEVGDLVTFTGYKGQVDGEGVLSEGQSVFITSYAQDSDGATVYNVATKRGGKSIESIYSDEFAAPSILSIGAKKPTDTKQKEEKTLAKKSTPKVVKDTQEEEEEVTQPIAKKVKAVKPTKVEESSTTSNEAKKADKAPKNMEDLLKQDAFSDSSEVISFIESCEGDALIAAREASNASDRERFLLAGVLTHIQRNKLHETILDTEGEPAYKGFEGFGEFCEKYIGISYRTAKNYQAIYSVFTLIGRGAEDFGNIGYTRAKEIVSLLKQGTGNINKIFAYAESHTVDEVKNYVTSKKVAATEEEFDNTKVVSLSKFTFALYEADAQFVTDALAIATNKLEADQKDGADRIRVASLALAEICRTYIDLHRPALGESDKTMTEEDMEDSLEDS